MFTKCFKNRRALNKENGCYVFDIDGTIADSSHRYEHATEAMKTHNWDLFNSFAHLDTPIHPVIKMNSLLYNEGVHQIVIATARTVENKDATEKWLDLHGVKFDAIYMRDFDIRDCDSILKLQMANDIAEEFGTIHGVFEDRKRVKKMWVELGAFVFDANQHDLEF